MNSAKAKYWLQASRPPSQAYIFFPLLLGQALWFSQSNTLNLHLACFTWLFGILIQLFIVYANDLADIGIDRLNTTFTPFSGGSRVVVEGKLSAADLQKGAAITAALNIVAGFYFYLVWGKPLAPILIIISLALLWLYSFPPVRLSYRGGGEFLQMTGVGIILPVFGYYIQASSLQNFPWHYLIAFLPLQLACAFSTTLPDEPSDKAGGKKTIAVILGIRAARQIVTGLHFISPLLLAGVMLHKQSSINPIYVTAVSIPCVAGMMILGSRVQPGNKAMLAFVTLSILNTIGLTAAMATERFMAGFKP